MDGSKLNKLVAVLEQRFEANMSRHIGLDWHVVQSRILASHTQTQTALYEMECTGGEPDVVGLDVLTGEVIFCDCSAESPIGRRSLCYDKAALDGRKKNKPCGSAVEMALAIGAELLTEAQYHELQTLGEFDIKTSCWIQTPTDIRVLGGAIFCDRRYGKVFTYHNGADSYYAARGFRVRLKV